MLQVLTQTVGLNWCDFNLDCKIKPMWFFVRRSPYFDVAVSIFWVQLVSFLVLQKRGAVTKSVIFI